MNINAARPGRRHHVVPRFHLRRFADAKRRLIAIDRRRDNRAIPMSVENASVRTGFYDVPGPGGTTGQLEDELSKIESLAAEITARLLSPGPDALEDRDRYRLSVFLGMQALRGLDFARSALAVAAENRRLHEQTSTPEAQAHVAELLGVHPSEVSEGQMVSGIDPAAPPPPEWWLRTAGLALGTETVSQELFVRTWGLLTMDEPSFMTSDRPIALYRDSSADGEPTGFKTADLVMMPLSRTSTLFMAREGFDHRGFIDELGRPADFVNSVIGASAYEWVFHHPEDAPLREFQLPAIDDDAIAEQLEYVTDGSTIRARSRVIPNLPTPPLGWTPAGR